MTGRTRVEEERGRERTKRGWMTKAKGPLFGSRQEGEIGIVVVL